MTARFFAALSFAIAALVLASAGAALAQETVSIANSNAVLLRPTSPRASIILMPGGEGHIGVGANGTISRQINNQLVRTRDAYLNERFAVLVVDATIDLDEAIQYMAAIKRPVTVIATSRGTLRAARGIARGARPDALVLTSGFLTNESGSRENVMNILGSPNALPRTLIIHHRRDTCHMTLPAGVDPFVRWAAGKAQVVWLDGGKNSGDPCRSRAYHGFSGLDSKVVSLAAQFAAKE